jgi:hypothetical protein
MRRGTLRHRTAEARVRLADPLVDRVDDLQPHRQRAPVAPCRGQALRQRHRAQVGAGAALEDPAVGVAAGVGVRLGDLVRAVEHVHDRHVDQGPLCLGDDPLQPLDAVGQRRQGAGGGGQRLADRLLHRLLTPAVAQHGRGQQRQDEQRARADQLRTQVGNVLEDLVGKQAHDADGTREHQGDDTVDVAAEPASEPCHPPHVRIPPSDDRSGPLSS